MRIYLNKFGNILISRQAGKEAYAAFLPSLKNVPENEEIEIDFDGVITFSPSWGDEFLTPLVQRFKDRLSLFNIGNNPSIIESLKIIEQTLQIRFKIMLRVMRKEELKEKLNNSELEVLFPKQEAHDGILVADIGTTKDKAEFKKLLYEILKNTGWSFIIKRPSEHNFAPKIGHEVNFYKI